MTYTKVVEMVVLGLAVVGCCHEGNGLELAGAQGAVVWKRR